MFKGSGLQGTLVAGAALVTGATETGEGSVLGEAGGAFGTRLRQTLVHLWARTHTLGYTHAHKHIRTNTHTHTYTFTENGLGWIRRELNASQM